MSEIYKGVKFSCWQRTDFCPFEPSLEQLNHWAWIFSQTGLMPVHNEGAYGNMSYRTNNHSFVITRTGMRPKRQLDNYDFCHVEFYDKKKQGFFYSGKHKPSSESFLHYSIYQQFEDVGAIMHGHSNLLNEWAAQLYIPVTSHFYDYGTIALANSALEIISMKDKIIVLKEHGFIAVGHTIAKTGQLVLETYMKLLSLLGETDNKKHSCLVKNEEKRK
ncbi:MAG: hypothetical protein CSA26_03860 [Desulfobacterales bacterium]|nr:MAG: hypothetical protein CSA26_03860 [Desulfobacterales bacterium]